MVKLTLEQQEALITNARKNVKYDTKEYTLELLHSKFNLEIEENHQTEIFIPFYQRKFVWKQNRQSKFIESIILGLPIPPMYFAEIEDGLLEVIDGSQRIRTINEFLSGRLKLKALKQLAGLNGLIFNDFSNARKRKIKNVTMRAVVVTDIEKDTMSIRHEIFERLNTGGEVLKKMEIKKGAQEGKFIEFIYTSCADNTLFNELSEFTKRDELRAYKEEFLVKYFAYSHSISFDCTLEAHLENYIDEQNNAFLNDEYKDGKLVRFKQMLELVNKNKLVNDLTVNRKNRLLAIYIGANLALKERPELTDNDSTFADIFTDEFIENARYSSFQKLKDNIQSVKETLLATYE